MSTGPFNQTFNWGDSDPVADSEFVHNFFHLAALPTATPANARAYAYTARRLLGPHPSCESGVCALSLMAYSNLGGPGDLAALPTFKSMAFMDSGWNGSQAVGFIREKWNDENAAYLAFKGGNAQANHNDDDGGDFVLDWMGKRWAADLGADSYGLSGYWDKSSAFGHR